MTEITLLGGARLLVEEEVRAVEKLILDAARGSIMQLAWLTDAHDTQPVGVNPEYVMTIRPVAAEPAAAGAVDAAPAAG